MTGPTADTAAAVHPVKSASSAGGEHGIGYPNGHLGHLNPEEEESLRKFKTYLEEQGAYKPRPPPSHDDQTLLRFLRARRWDVAQAYKQFQATEDWRKANDINVLYDTIDSEAYDQARRLYPQWTGRRDKRGIPLYLFEIRHLDSKTVSQYEKDSETAFTSKAKTDGSTPAKLLRLFALYENLTRFAQPLCTHLPDREHAHVPITLSTNIVDVSGVSLRQFWNLKAHMQAASTLATAHYPETLDRIFIIGAPYFFSTVWGWIKRWFDPITVSKIFILSANEVKPTLESFIHPQNIPKQYGGELDFKWGDKPTLDPTIQKVAVWEKGYSDFPIGPLYWTMTEDGTRLECIASGTVDQKERRDKVCSIPATWPPRTETKKTEETDKPIEEAVKGLSITEGEGAKDKVAAEISEKTAATEATGTDDRAPATVAA
ncbi:SEC14 cytosolic factor [Rhypophila decipiens]|uniref:SEC14 cytosolic factor n=1 Tax=Rhypophila decipiens TaxID=261697 RepID=A0AAN6XWF0_9PEZI|nr:SEC14 cytosolic factor [Rhypophila decipiens]